MGDLPSGPSSGGNDGGFSRRPGRFPEGGQVAGGPPTIDQSRLPTCAPFTAFIGNLPFDIAETDVRTFFQMRSINASSILHVKLPRDIVENKSRGFGYVEFASVDDLTRALMSSNQFSIRNRVVRVDMSDSKQNDREVRPAEANHNWRDAPAGAARTTPAGSRGMEHREERPLSVAEASRNWRDGAKPIEKTSTFGSAAAPRAEAEDRRSAPRPAFVAEPVRNWRDGAKPVERTAHVEAPAVAVKVEENMEKKSVRPAAEPSKVPAGPWRR